METKLEINVYFYFWTHHHIQVDAKQYNNKQHMGCNAQLAFLGEGFLWQYIRGNFSLGRKRLGTLFRVICPGVNSTQRNCLDELSGWVSGSLCRITSLCMKHLWFEPPWLTHNTQTDTHISTRCIR